MFAAPQVVRHLPTNPHFAHARCESCPLYDPKRPPVAGQGNPDAKLAVVGEAPSTEERLARKPFVGMAGELLNQTLASCGIQRKDTYVTLAVACRGIDRLGDDEAVPAKAVECCRPRLLSELNAVNPNLILSTGATAAKTLLGTKQSITEIQGVVEHRPDVPAPVLPTTHPAFALHGGDAAFDDFLSCVDRAVRISDGRLVLPPRDEIIPWKHLRTAQEAIPVLRSLLAGDGGFHLSIDVETDGLDVVSKDLLQVAIGNAERAAVFEADAVKHGTAHRLMVNLLEDPRFTWNIHNSSFDIQWIKEHFGVVPPNIVDTLCLAMGLTEHGKRTGLKRLARDYLNAPHYEEGVHEYLSADNSVGWAEVPRELLGKYAARDVVYTSRMQPILDNLCVEEGTLRLAYELLMPAQQLFAEVERHGVLVDLTYVNEVEAEWVPRVEESIKAIQDYASEQGFFQKIAYKEKVKHEWVEEKTRTYKSGKTVTTQKPKSKIVWEPRERLEPINPKSPKQLAEFMFDHLKLRPPGGNRTTGEEFRDAYPHHPLTKLLEEFGLANKMLGTYIRGIRNHVKADNRVHPSFRVGGARTGRLSMSAPSLQVIPKERTAQKFASIKRMFLPSPGFVWVESDYSQLEVRVAWHLSNDEVLGEAVMSGDFHKAMASRIYGVPVEAVTEAQRDNAKTTVFAVMYGTTPYGLSMTLGVSVETAEMLIEGLFAQAPKYRDWYKAQQRNALENGEVQTVFGRKRRWPLITRENKGHVLNQSVNFPGQSTASDITLAAGIKIQQELKVRNLGTVLFLVHDAVVSEIREGREAEGVEVIESIMKTWPFPSNAVLDVETKVGPTWGDTVKWKGGA